jgi:mycothiol synthase
MRLRPPREHDFDAILEVLNASTRAAYGDDQYGAEELRAWFTSPKVDPERDIRVAEVDDRLVGYVDVDPQGADPVRWWSLLRVRPEAEVGAVAAELMEWVESRAEEGLIRVWAPSKVKELVEAFEELGFRAIRHSYRMMIELDEEPAPPAWPAGVTVRTLRAGEESAVYEAYREAWVDTWEPEEDSYKEWAHYMTERGDFDPSLWFLACDGGEIAGISLCRPSETVAGAAWVSILAVRRPWRRRGLGEALLRHSFREFRARGFTHGGLGVDADSPTGAPRLYERVGMKVVRRFDFFERELGTR